MPRVTCIAVYFRTGLAHLIPEEQRGETPADRLVITTGLKLEHNDYTGLELQPNLRGVFRPSERQTLWAAVSRAVRTPSQIEGGNAYAFFAGPPLPGPGDGLHVPAVVGNRNPEAEVLVAYELGYRVQATRRLSVDLATFYNDYEKLISYGRVLGFSPGAPVGLAEIPYVNIAEVQTYGAGLSFAYSASDTLRLRGTWSLLLKEVEIEPGYLREEIDRAPRNQASLGLQWDPVRRVNLDLQGRYVEDSAATPGYFMIDARIAWRPNERLEFALVGQNLLDPQHPEQAPEAFTRVNEIPRSVHGKVTWRF